MWQLPPPPVPHVRRQKIIRSWHPWWEWHNLFHLIVSQLVSPPALNSWGCTSQRTSPEPPTPCQSPRRHNSAYTFSAGSHRPSLKPHTNPLPPETLWIFVQFKVCYTQVIGPVQTSCSNTLCFICTRHFHTLLCVHNPTKDSEIYVCLHAHSLQITLHCSPASCLNVSLFAHVQYLRGICTVVQFAFSLFMYR